MDPSCDVLIPHPKKIKYCLASVTRIDLWCFGFFAGQSKTFKNIMTLENLYFFF